MDSKFNLYRKILFLVSIGVFGFFLTTLAEEVRISKGHNKGKGFKKSDVCLSLRGLRSKTVEEHKDVLRAFRATRLEWTYIAPEVLKAIVDDMGINVNFAISTGGGQGLKDRDAEDFDGEKMVAPWMMTWQHPPAWACANRQGYREFQLQRIKDVIDIGVGAIQHDDWKITFATNDWGGCFCPDCMREFSKFLSRHLSKKELVKMGIRDIGKFNYREYLKQRCGINNLTEYQQRKNNLPFHSLFIEFQKESVRDYFKWLSKNADAYTGRHIVFSINDGFTWGREWDDYFVIDLVDYMMGETRIAHNNFRGRAAALKLADIIGKPQVVSPLPHRVNETREWIAETYALGHFPLVPYDIYMGSDDTGSRYYGTPEQYADLYHFVRDNANLFDDYVPVEQIGVLFTSYSALLREKKLLPVLGQMLESNISYGFVAVAGEGDDCTARQKDIERFEFVIMPRPTHLKEEQSYLLGWVSKGKIIPIEQMQQGQVESILEEFEPYVSVHGARHILALPRRISAVPEAPIVCHLLNRNYDAASDAIKPQLEFTVCVSKKLVGGKMGRCTLYRPREKPLELRVEQGEQGFCIRVPEIELWGILKFEQGSRAQQLQGETKLTDAIFKEGQQYAADKFKTIASSLFIPIKIIDLISSKKGRKVRVMLYNKASYPVRVDQVNIMYETTVKTAKGITLKGGEEKTVEFALNGDAGDISKVKIEARIGPYTVIREELLIPPAVEHTCSEDLLVARRVKAPLEIDGTLHGWEQAVPIELNKEYQVNRPSSWRGPRDLSAIGYFLWDDENLYFACKVTDDQFFNRFSHADGLQSVWNADAIQIALDPMRDALVGQEEYNADDQEINFSLTKDGENLYRIRGPGGDIVPISGTKLIIRRWEKGLIYTLKIPFREIIHYKPEVGRRLRLTFVVNDDDNGKGMSKGIGVTAGTIKAPGVFKDLMLID